MSGLQLQALVVTWLIEVPVLCWSLRGLPLAKVVLVGLVASLLTHPVAWWAASLLSPHDYTRGVWTIEACVWLAEAFVILLALRVGVARSALASGGANLASFALGGWLLG